MLRLALSLLSSLQVGARIKQSFQRSLRQAVAIAAAIIVLTGASAFGLFAAYQILVASYAFTPAEAAGIIAGALLLLGLFLFALVPLLGRQQAKPEASAASTLAEGVAGIDQQLGKAMQQVSPITLVAIAFIAGLLASRRR